MLVHTDRSDARRPVGMRRRSTLLALLSALAVLIGCGATAASASTGSLSASAASQASFCGLAASLAPSLENPEAKLKAPTSLAGLATIESSLRNALEKLKLAEPSLLSAAPSTLQPDIMGVFGFDNLLLSDLAKVHFTFLDLVAYRTSIEAAGKRAKGDVAGLVAYFKNTCKSKSA